MIGILNLKWVYRFFFTAIRNRPPVCILCQTMPHRSLFYVIIYCCKNNDTTYIFVKWHCCEKMTHACSFQLNPNCRIKIMTHVCNYIKHGLSGEEFINLSCCKCPHISSCIYKGFGLGNHGGLGHNFTDKGHLIMTGG